MRVAIVNQHFDTSSPTGPMGSLAIWSYQVARRLVREPGCEVVIYEQPRTDDAPEARIEGITFRRVPTRRIDRLVARALQRIGKHRDPLRGHFAHGLHYYDYARRVARDIRARGCDIVHIHNFSQFVTPIRAANPKATIVLHMNCDWLAQLDAGLLEPRLAKCDLIIGCSEHVTDAVRRRFPHYADRCRTVFNGVDTDWFVPGPQQPEHQCRRVLFCGRVSPEKGVHDLLDAFATVVEEQPDASLEILGSIGAAPREYMVAVSSDPRVRVLERFYAGGADYGNALRQRMSAETAARTTFTSFVPQQEVPQRVRAADMLVLPSLTESFGMPLAEAMASGIPVIAARTGGMPEVVEDGITGMVVEPANPSALGAAILKMMALEPSVREEMGRRGRERALRLFSWDRVAESLLPCYREARAARADAPLRPAEMPRLAASA